MQTVYLICWSPYQFLSVFFSTTQRVYRMSHRNLLKTCSRSAITNGNICSFNSSCKVELFLLLVAVVNVCI